MTDASAAPKPGPEDRTVPPSEKKKKSYTKVALLVLLVLAVFAGGFAALKFVSEEFKARTQTAGTVAIPGLGEQIAKGVASYLQEFNSRLDTMSTELNAQTADVATLKGQLGEQQKQIGNLEKEIQDLKTRPLQLNADQLDEQIKKSLSQQLPSLHKSKQGSSALSAPPAKPKAPEAPEAKPAQPLVPRAAVPAPPRKPASIRQAAIVPSVCAQGAVVRQHQGSFRIDTLVVEDGSSVVETIGKEKGAYRTWAFPLLKAARDGSVKRFSGNGTLIFHLLNIDSASMPDRISYLEGETRCAGDAAVVDRGIGFADIEVPINGEHAGQVSLVLPAKAMLRVGASLCIETSFPLAYAPHLTAGSYKGMKNVLCGGPFDKDVSAGKRGGLFVLIHGQAKEI